MLSYLQLGRRSSSPHPQHRPPTASLCSSARSVRQESHTHTHRHTYTHTYRAMIFRQTHTPTQSHTQIPTGARYMCVQMPQTHNKCFHHEKSNTPPAYKCNSFAVKLLLLSLYIQWDYMYERGDMGGHDWKKIQDWELKSWDVCKEAKAAQIDASLRRFTEQSQTVQTNGKASIHFSFWNGQHGLLMMMELEIKELSGSCNHTLLPSKGSSFSSESRERDKNMCEWDFLESVEVTFYFCSWKTSSLLFAPHKIKQAENELEQT